MAAILGEVDSLADLKDAITQPEVFLNNIAEGTGDIATKVAIMYLKPKLPGFLEDNDLQWSDVEAVLFSSGSLAELKSAVGDPVAFLEGLAASPDTGKKMAIMYCPHLIDYILRS